MISNQKLSIVLPVRNGQDRIAARVESVLAMLAELAIEGAEIIVVDDGSVDATAEILDGLCTNHPRIRLMRHSRARGMEAAGQTGLERATGDLVFIQESDCDLRTEDMLRLIRMADDPSIVAARSESATRPLSDELVRRLRAWGTDGNRQLASPESHDGPRCSLQMIRRPHLHTLAGPKGSQHRLVGETTQYTSLQNG